jgi:hypothetical protein
VLAPVRVAETDRKVFLMEKRTEIEIIMDMIKEYPNDKDFGGNYRKYCLTYKGKLDEYCITYPNDFDLGSFLRKKI